MPKESINVYAAYEMFSANPQHNILLGKEIYDGDQYLGIFQKIVMMDGREDAAMDSNGYTYTLSLTGVPEKHFTGDKSFSYKDQDLTEAPIPKSRRSRSPSASPRRSRSSATSPRRSRTSSRRSRSPSVKAQKGGKKRKSVKRKNKNRK